MTTTPALFRNRLGPQYRSAALNRLRGQAVVVGAGSTLEITGLCPSVAECLDSPGFHIMASFIGSADGVPNPDALALSLVVTDDAADQSAAYPYTGEEETDGIRARHLFARDPATGFLECPEGTANRVFLRNDSASDLAILLVFEIPTLDWRAVVPQTRAQAERQQWAIELESGFLARVGNENVLVGANAIVEITNLVPLAGPAVRNGGFVHLHATYAPADITAPVAVLVSPSNLDLGGYLPTPGSLLNDAGGTGLPVTVRVRALRPRDPVGGLVLLDGQRVFLANQDGVNDTTVNVFFEVPLLDWR